jgi:hypothetical protein
MHEALYYVLVFRPCGKNSFDAIDMFFNARLFSNSDIAKNSILVPDCGRDYRKGELRKLVMDRVMVYMDRHSPSDSNMTVQDYIKAIVIEWNNDVIDAARKEPVVPPVKGAYAFTDLGVCVNNY